PRLCRRARPARRGRRRRPSARGGGGRTGRGGGAGPRRPPPPEALRSRSGLSSDDADRLAATLGAELDGTGGQREQGVVLATADVVTGVELRAALADEDLARVDELAAEALDAEALGVGVAAVPGGAGTLLRCHGEACFRVVRTGARGPGLLDAGDLDPGQLLAVTLADAVARLVLVLLDRDLLTLLGTHDLGG